MESISNFFGRSTLTAGRFAASWAKRMSNISSKSPDQFAGLLVKRAFQSTPILLHKIVQVVLGDPICFWETKWYALDIMYQSWLFDYSYLRVLWIAPHERTSVLLSSIFAIAIQQSKQFMLERFRSLSHEPPRWLQFSDHGGIFSIKNER